MQRNVWMAIGFVLLLLIGVFYVLSNNQVKSEREKEIELNTANHNFEKVLAYENDYMGNASNMGNLFNNIPLSSYKDNIELDSDAFTFIINYDTTSDEEAEKAVIYNATAAFVLVKNLEVINMRFLNNSYVVTRENVEEWFGGDLKELIDPSMFKEKVQKPLLKSEINDWLASYTN
ncbi:DUF4825 domain-containing protein [Psychrobacillus vulpis]|uniref:DUF4825 domain-containing protein n=1 Tax=Psychrobacillus vulpis TaxID=2325572 RepID=UPI00140A9D47|nr:DUF4825 domain-containing protein [Psychrobacillus vulpis]